MLLKKIFLLPLLLLSVLFLGCQKEEEAPPVPMGKMSKVLVDLQFSESYSIGLGFDTLSGANQFKKNQDSLEVFYTSIFKHYQLTSDQFFEAMNWYRNQPGKMDSLMSMSLQEFDRQKTEFDIPEFKDENLPKENTDVKPEEKKDQSLLKNRLEERSEDMNLEVE